MVSVVDLAWLAGLIEGDGTIGLLNGKYVRIEIANTDLTLLKEVRKRFGGGIYERRPGKLERKKMYSWQKTGHKARMLAEALLPFIKGSKREPCFELLGRPRYRPLEGPACV